MSSKSVKVNLIFLCNILTNSVTRNSVFSIPLPPYPELFAPHQMSYDSLLRIQPCLGVQKVSCKVHLSTLFNTINHNLQSRSDIAKINGPLITNWPRLTTTAQISYLKKHHIHLSDCSYVTFNLPTQMDIWSI